MGLGLNKKRSFYTLIVTLIEGIERCEQLVNLDFVLMSDLIKHEKKLDRYVRLGWVM